MEATATVVNVIQSADTPALAPDSEVQHSVLSLKDFITAFGDGLLETVRRQNPPVFVGEAHPARDSIITRSSANPSLASAMACRR